MARIDEHARGLEPGVTCGRALWRLKREAEIGPSAEAAQHGKAEQRGAEQRECARLGYLDCLPQIVADNVQGGNVVALYRMPLIRAGKRIVRVRRIGCVPVLRIAAEGVGVVETVEVRSPVIDRKKLPAPVLVTPRELAPV